ncbi:sentrin-specific protease 7 isoform X3 [Ambystoma mexicanum]|uniref:sentrin-specific protease 7 isoform X3 n=1 Tax=Ambystoma mexicanum TaxID=8296 RepID=UPI0037E90180
MLPNVPSSSSAVVVAAGIRLNRNEISLITKMEEQKNKSPSPSPNQDNIRKFTFRIPKKKPNSWSEEIETTSPLSCFSSDDFQNRPAEKKCWRSCSEYNRTRNYSYHNNRALGRPSLRTADFPSRCEQHEKLSSSPRPPSLLPEEHTRNSALPTDGGCSKELKGNQKSDNPKKSKKDLENFSLELEDTQDLNSVTRKRCSTPCTEEHRPPPTEKTALQNKESVESCITTSTSKNSSENNRCLRNNYPSPDRLQENVQHPLIRGRRVPIPLSNTQEPVSDHSSKALICKESNEHCLKTAKNISTDKIKTREKLLNLRKCRHRPYRMKSVTNPVEVEPIVLSSDEEDRSSTDFENTDSLHYPIIQDRLTDQKETELNSKPPLSETSKDGENKMAEQSMRPDEPLQITEMGVIATNNDENISPILEVEFRMVYIGRRKARSKGCVKFSTTSVKIPLYENLHGAATLYMDCRHIKKCGLWMNISELSMRSNAFIFLWITQDYIQEILRKLRIHNPSNVKGFEFIFLELHKPLTDEEQNQLCELIRGWSTKNKQEQLSDLMSWDDATPLLKDLSRHECSFLSNCNISYKTENSTTAESKHAPQETIVNIYKPSYTLLRKCTFSNYAVSLIPKPDGEWKEIKSKGSVQKLIVYPPPPTKGGLGVTQEDLECLEHGEFLNDVIIDFYLKYLLLEKVPQPLVERSHIFSSFFFRCLTRTENTFTDENQDTSAAQRRHHRVKTWTRHVDIFKKDFIFVPVNEESHWYLAVICFPWLEKALYEENKKSNEIQPLAEADHLEDPTRKSTVIVFNDACSKKEELSGNSSSHSEGEDQHTSGERPLPPKVSKVALEKHSGKTKVCKRPCILIFDSLKAGSVQNTVQVLREYLEVEWKVKRKSSREFSRSSMRDYSPRVPKQDNSSDCGVYLLQYVESFFKAPIVSFEPPMHMEHWFPRHVVRIKRDQIRDLILQLHLQQKGVKSR